MLPHIKQPGVTTLIGARGEPNPVDPAAVIAEARGDVEESLLTRTGGGFLRRNVLADDPLLKHLRPEESLHYLLAGPAPPTRTGEGAGGEVATSGSYRTLVAVTDARLLVVAGSADGDRRFEFPYADLRGVEHRAGLLTGTVAFEDATGVVWEVTVSEGSSPGAAVEYVRERLPSTVADPDPATGDEGGGPAIDAAGDLATGDAETGGTEEDAEEAQDGPFTVPEADPPDAEETAAGVSDGTGDDAGRTTLGDVDRLSTGGDEKGAPVEGDAGTTASEDPGAADERTAGAAGESKGPGADAGGATGSAPAGVPRSEFVGEMFDRLLGDRARAPSVEGYADRGIDRLLEDIGAHHQRVRTHLAEGDVGAARGAAATVDALADEGERIAAGADRPDAGQRVARHRWLARRAVVAAELGVDADALDGALAPTLKALLQGVDPYEFEQLVAALWDELGYQTTVTQSSKDKGVDVVARQSTPVEQTVVIQAKRYGPNTKVGREEVQQYASLHRQEPDADLVVVVTTGAFTGPAMEAAGDLDVKLVDGDRLVGIIAERDLFGLVARYVSA